MEAVIANEGLQIDMDKQRHEEEALTTSFTCLGPREQ